MQKMISGCKSNLRLLVASIRTPDELADLAGRGCDTFTFSPAIAAKLFTVESTIQAAADFEAAARRNGAY
jgi:transaldolase